MSDKSTHSLLTPPMTTSFLHCRPLNSASCVPCIPQASRTAICIAKMCRGQNKVLNEVKPACYSPRCPTFRSPRMRRDRVGHQRAADPKTHRRATRHNCESLRRSETYTPDSVSDWPEKSNFMMTWLSNARFHFSKAFVCQQWLDTHRVDVNLVRIKNITVGW